jgi:hypothetical protein
MARCAAGEQCGPVRTAIPNDRPGEGDVLGIEPNRDHTVRGARSQQTLMPSIRRSPSANTREVGLVRCDGLYADGSDETNPRLESPGYSSGCSGLSDLKPVPPRRNGPHRQRSGQDARAGAHGSISALVSRSRQRIHTQILHVDLEVPDALCRVENEQSTPLVSNLGNFFDRRHAARDTRGARGRRNRDDRGRVRRNDRGLYRMSLSISPPDLRPVAAQ